MSLALRLVFSLALFLLAAPLAAADSQTAPAGESGTHAWTNPGKLLPCEFRSGTLTVTGILHSRGCDPNSDPECGLTLEVLSIKEDSIRGFLAHDPDQSCTVKLENGYRPRLRQMWKKSGEGHEAVRVSGLMTDGVMTVTRFRVLGPADGLR